MMREIVALILCLSFLSGRAQKTDTLRFYSEAFSSDREVYVITPEFYKYQSDELELPLVYILDAQHDWFFEPMKSDVRYLQYTHEIPQVIIVGIPHKDRYKECPIERLDGEPLPLHTFITEELEEELKSYHPSSYRVLIGHSFSASFSLYSFIQSPDFYAAVIANSPGDQIEEIGDYFEQHTELDLSRIYWSVGGAAKAKDYFQRKELQAAKEKHPATFEAMNLMEADAATHNSVPRVTVPSFLSQLFEPFSSRYDEVAPVDLNYQLVNEPESIEIEIEKVKKRSSLGSSYYPPELPEINGVASRYQNSGYNDHAKALYHWGVELFPKSFDFYLQLADLSYEDDPEQCKNYLDRVLEPLATVDSDLEDRSDLEAEILEFYEENG